MLPAQLPPAPIPKAPPERLFGMKENKTSMKNCADVFGFVGIKIHKYGYSKQLGRI